MILEKLETILGNSKTGSRNFETILGKLETVLGNSKTGSRHLKMILGNSKPISELLLTHTACFLY